MANRRYESQFFYSMHAMPVWIDCGFTVDDTNASGITGLVGGGVKNVFMHTSTTPTTGSPNPDSGFIYVQLQDNYKKLYSHSVDFISPLTGSDLPVTSGLDAGKPYTITALGNTTAAEWVTLGVPVGVTAAVGVSFIAISTGTGSSTGTVKLSGVSGISHAELIYNPLQTLSLANSRVNGGSVLIFQTLAATNSGTTTLVATAPAAGTRVRINLLLSNSSVLIQGE
jgi:hypothetical protein